MTLESLDNLLEEIAQKEYLESPNLLVSPGLKSSAIKNLLEKTEYRFDTSILDFYESVNLIDIGWSLSNNNYKEKQYDFNIRGRIVIESLEQLIRRCYPENTHNFLWFDQMDSVEIKSRQMLVPFDIGLPEETVCLKKTGVFVEDRLYLCSKYEEELVDMKMGVEDYTQKCLQTKGMEWWQRAALNLDDEARERIVSTLPELFPQSPFPIKNF